MKCPFCHFNSSNVVDSRLTEDGCSVRRRRLCIKCSRRFTTYERYESTPLIVIKKDKRRESFDRQKILQGLLKSCEKRPISLHKIEALTDEIEKEIRGLTNGEISTLEVGKIIMDKLKSLDEIAYVRFASVYKEFKDIDKFAEELKVLEDSKQTLKPKKIVAEQGRLLLE